MPRTPVLTIFLTLSLLAGLSTVNVPPAFAAFQNGLTTWSPFGPRTNNLVITPYLDFPTIVDAFLSGQVDLPDSPVAFCGHPDVFCTDPQATLSIRQLDINHHAPFLGIALQEPRVPGIPTLTVTGTASGCPPGTGRVNVTLENMEEGNNLVLDPLNALRWVGPQSGGVRDDPVAGTNVDGVYSIPSPSGCTLTGTYTLRATVYSGSVSLTIGSGQVTSARLGVNYNSPTTMKLTQASVEIRRAIAHLLDKPNLVSQEFPAGNAEYDDVQASSSQALDLGGPTSSRLPQSVLDEDCQAHPWHNPGNCHPVSAYNLDDDLIGPSLWWTSLGSRLGVRAGYPGLADIRAACDHLGAAGFSITPAGATCEDVANASVGSSVPSSYPHFDNNGQVLILHSRSDPARRHLGQVFFDSLNLLFGTPNNSLGGTVRYQPGCNPFHFSGILCIFPGAIFDTTSPDDWNLYTGGWGLAPSPEQFYTLYHSSFASSVCGGNPTPSFSGNYPMYCNPALDTVSFAGEFAGSQADSGLFFAQAALLAHRTAMTIPIYTPRQTWSALNGWNYQATGVPTQSSLVTSTVQGFAASSQGAYWSLLNMRQVPGYSPSLPEFAPGGGDSTLIRRGWSLGTVSLNPFIFLMPQDLELIQLLYDSMLLPNPQTSANQQVINWMTTSHTSVFNPLEISCTDSGPVPLCATGTTTQLWKLRNDIKWHDGAQVTAEDVAYSINAHASAGALLLPPPASVLSVEIVDARTVMVRIPGQSSFYTLDVGSVPIVPKHIWAPLCGDPFDPLSQCTDSSFDAMAAGLLVGSGAWVCKNLETGAVGGSCVSRCSSAGCTLGGQEIVRGDKIILTANSGFFRGRPGVQDSSLHKLSWADENNDGTVDILDLASLALRFGSPDSYWNTGQNTLAPNVGTDPNIVDIGELASLAFYFDHSLITPFSPNELKALDPQIDPFFCPPNGC